MQNWTDICRGKGVCLFFGVKPTGGYHLAKLDRYLPRKRCFFLGGGGGCEADWSLPSCEIGQIFAKEKVCFLFCFSLHRWQDEHS